MFNMDFKKLKIKKESNWFRRTIKNKHTIRSIIFIIIGAIAGVLYFYFIEEKHFNNITTGELLKSMFIGGFFGFFITNSPCARNKC